MRARTRHAKRNQSSHSDGSAQWPGELFALFEFRCLVSVQVILFCKLHSCIHNIVALEPRAWWETLRYCLAQMEDFHPNTCLPKSCFFFGCRLLPPVYTCKYLCCLQAYIAMQYLGGLWWQCMGCSKFVFLHVLSCMGEILDKTR